MEVEAAVDVRRCGRGNRTIESPMCCVWPSRIEPLEQAPVPQPAATPQMHAKRTARADRATEHAEHDRLPGLQACEDAVEAREAPSHRDR